MGAVDTAESTEAPAMQVPRALPTRTSVPRATMRLEADGQVDLGPGPTLHAPYVFTLFHLSVTCHTAGDGG